MEFSKQIESLFRTGTAGGLTDGQLLERYLEHRGDEAEMAFAALVDRHGAMVLRLCRQILRGEEDAEDAAQATFLVLARRARTIGRRESIACWLHGVALRVAANARVAAIRRRARELRGGEMRTAGQVVDSEVSAIESHEDWATLHDELGALPRFFREPLILCYLDGFSQKQAAAELRCPLGTIQSRLARGKAKLRARLEKRGVVLSPAFAVANELALQGCPTPQAWAEVTVRVAMQFAQSKGGFIRGASAASVVLAEETVRAIVLTKLKVVATAIMVAFVSLSGAAVWAIHDRRTDESVVANRLASRSTIAEPNVAQEKVAPVPEFAKPTIRGLVRDELGRRRRSLICEAGTSSVSLGSTPRPSVNRTFRCLPKREKAFSGVSS